MSERKVQEYDIIILGAGISGISAAYHIQTICPANMTYKILERRSSLGGTWDLFNYPGIRSDSDMYTFGYSFKPWSNADHKLIAPKSDILQYLKETVSEYNIEEHIIYEQYIQTASWNSSDSKWTLTGITSNNEENKVAYKTQYLFLCVGYYNYDKPYVPNFPDAETFQGPIIHPQLWPTTTKKEESNGESNNNNKSNKNTKATIQDALDYANKHVVVIGSGATAVTLIPALTKGDNAAKHVTMIQRSPTYMAARPSKMTFVGRTIANIFGHHVARWYYVLTGMLIYSICTWFPNFMKHRLIKFAKYEINNDDVFDEKDFTPRYNPWDQRLCLCPDGDFFKTLQSKKASIVTDHIVKFTKTGIQLQNQQDELRADIIITATGLQLQFAGGIQFHIDNKPLELNKKFVYKGFMMDHVPNLFVAGGYTNASWTLKIDLTMKASCRLIDYMKRNNYKYCQAETPSSSSSEEKDVMPKLPLLDLTSGYVQRSLDEFPKQSSFVPWRLYQNYLYDKYVLEYTSLQDSYMKFYK